MCPNKLHKDFSSRERERDVEKGWSGGLGQNYLSHWNAHLHDFSLCLIQCAISRCIIYFCVKSLTAVICHYDDDIDDFALFSRYKDVMIDYGSRHCLTCPNRGMTSDLGSRSLSCQLQQMMSSFRVSQQPTNDQTHISTASNKYFDFRFLVPYITRLF